MSSPFISSINYISLRSCWLTVWGYTPGSENQGEDPRPPSDQTELFLSLLQDAEPIWPISSVCVKTVLKQTHLAILLGYLFQEDLFTSKQLQKVSVG